MALSFASTSLHCRALTGGGTSLMRQDELVECKARQAVLRLCDMLLTCRAPCCSPYDPSVSYQQATITAQILCAESC